MDPQFSATFNRSHLNPLSIRKERSMRSTMRGEVLQYDESRICQLVLNEDNADLIGLLKKGDIVIVVEDKGTDFLKIMLPNGRKGWTRFVFHRFLKLEHVSPLSRII